MSVNSSSSSNASLTPSSLSSSINMYSFLSSCFKSTAGTVISTAYAITCILVILPLCIFVLYLGHQRWRQQRSSTSMNHSDLFTYHMVVIEMTGVLGSILFFCGVRTDFPQMKTAGSNLFSINLSGQMLFHILTCVERYLAVVHPITYLSLRKAKGIRIRNITIGCVWLLCFAMISLTCVEDLMDTMFYCITAFALIVISFCSLSVLYVLIRPGPGEGGGDRQRVDQSKLRAFYTIMAILGVLLFRLGGNVLSVALHDSPHLGKNGICGVWLSGFWFCLPSGLLQPLLFLHRAGKLLCCNK